jgi:acetyl esterase
MPLDASIERLLGKLTAVSATRTELTVAERRSGLEQLLALGAESVPVAEVQARTLPGAEGALPARVYTPHRTAGTRLPGLLYFHGGGLVAGSLQSHDAVCRALASATGCRLVALEYRLAPEHPFPAALMDGLAALGWMAAHAADLGLDAERIGVAGDSAGATLAAALCQIAPRIGHAPIALQLLLCPILDITGAYASRREFARGYLLEQAILEHDLKYYLRPGDDAADPRVSPLRCPDLSGLPPACIHTAECDPMRDEGAAYAQRLEAAGVPVSYRCHSGMIHLFYGLGALVPYVARAYELIGSDVRGMLARCGEGE